jgi:hypothetical protein
MNVTGWGYVPARKPANRKPYRRYFVLSTGRTVTAAMLARDPDNVHDINRNTLRARLLRGMTDPTNIFQPRLPAGRRPKGA